MTLDNLELPRPAQAAEPGFADVPDLAFYRREGDRYVPTGIGVSPWNGKTQNGVSVAGLAAHLLNKACSPVAMTPARLTFDIYGAVPMAPMSPNLRVLREGRSVQLLEVTLEAEGRTWLRATGLRVRTADTAPVAAPLTRDFVERGPDTGGVSWAEWIRLEGDFARPGPGAQWLRFKASVVAGEPLSPVEAVVMAADFGTGTAPPLAVKDWSLANVDLSVHLTRLPASPWLLLDAVSETAGNGLGVTHTRLGDRRGMIGAAHQTMFVTPARRD